MQTRACECTHTQKYMSVYATCPHVIKQKAPRPVVQGQISRSLLPLPHPSSLTPWPSPCLQPPMLWNEPPLQCAKGNPFSNRPTTYWYCTVQIVLTCRLVLTVYTLYTHAQSNTNTCGTWTWLICRVFWGRSKVSKINDKGDTLRLISDCILWTQRSPVNYGQRSIQDIPSPSPLTPCPSFSLWGHRFHLIWKPSAVPVPPLWLI